MTSRPDAIMTGTAAGAAPDTSQTPAACWAEALSQGQSACVALAAELPGAFSIGIHDAARGRTFLAVDRFAIHTLCFRQAEGGLMFAERADDGAVATQELDAQALFDYLYFHCIPSPRTIFGGVQRLPPGHYAWYEGGALTVAPYWIPSFTPDRQTPDFQALRDEFRQLLQQAVSRQLDGGIAACFLSGGTDSSTVAGMIGLATGHPARSYSIGFEAEGYDEMAYARIAARHFGTDHREYYVTPDDLVRGVPTVAAHYDQPFGNSSALPAFYCAKLARDEGVTRLLAGDGGDELFGGNSRYSKQRVFGWYRHLPASIRSAVLEPLLERTPLARLPGFSKALSYIEQAREPMPDRLRMYNLLLRLGVAEVLEPGFVSHVDEASPGRLQREVWAGPRALSEVDRTLAFDWRFTLAESDLPKVRGTAHLAGVEVGFPLLDTTLVDFSCRLSPDYKLKGLKLRWFFKEALRGFLPDEIITKPKQGFGLPFGVWATRHAALRSLAEDSLRSLGTRGIVRPMFIRDLLERRLAQHPGYFGEMVWILMMLEQWMRQHAPNYRVAA
jgi:asparagine synthase (glutamine-hydrolysing)